MARIGWATAEVVKARKKLDEDKNALEMYKIEKKK